MERGFPPAPSGNPGAVGKSAVKADVGREVGGGSRRGRAQCVKLSLASRKSSDQRDQTGAGAQARRRWPWPGGTDVAVEELRALKDIMKRIV